MQIDFHHTVTYVLARLAGFKHEDAHIISYSAQYVDDATNGGTIIFEDDIMYTRISSAHKMIDKRHLNKLKSHLVWIPFHFLPGNNGEPEGAFVKGSFIRKLVCKPDSYVAKDMIDACFNDRDKPYALHRLGITLHVYADTWAHREFAGVNHDINDASLPKELKPSKANIFKRIYRAVINKFTNDLMTLGHGAALTYPDMPYMDWKYTNGLGEEIIRKNTDEFMEAAQALFNVLLKYQGKNEAPIPQQDKNMILTCFQGFKHEDGHQRHRQWLEAIAQGAFTFGSQTIDFIPKGEGSWKHSALGTREAHDYGNEKFKYSPEFLDSNWKKFHDALQAHRFDVVHDILPRYGICAG